MAAETGLGELEATLHGVVPFYPASTFTSGAHLHAECENVRLCTLVPSLRRVVAKDGTRVCSEARRLSALRGVPGVIRLAGYSAHHIFLEYNPRLRDLIDVLPALNAMPRRVSAQRSTSIAASVCGTLARLHAMGIAHLDVKLENVLVDAVALPSAALDVTLIDFGLSRVHWPPSTPRRAHTSGSLVCMAPETLEANCGKRGRAPRPSCDSWCAGSLLFQLCFGTYPFAPPRSEEPRELQRVAAAKREHRLDTLARQLVERRTSQVPELRAVLGVWAALCAAEPERRLSCAAAHRALLVVATGMRGARGQLP